MIVRTVQQLEERGVVFPASDVKYFNYQKLNGRNDMIVFAHGGGTGRVVNGDDEFYMYFADGNGKIAQIKKGEICAGPHKNAAAHDFVGLSYVMQKVRHNDGEPFGLIDNPPQLVVLGKVSGRFQSLTPKQIEMSFDGDNIPDAMYVELRKKFRNPEKEFLTPQEFNYLQNIIEHVNYRQKMKHKDMPNFPMRNLAKGSALEEVFSRR